MKLGGNSSSNYSRVIPKRNMTHDSKQDNQAFDEKQQDQDQGSIDWFENQLDGMQGIKTNAHSGANSQNLIIDPGAKKITQPQITSADTSGILKFTQSQSTQTKQPKINGLTIPVSKAIPTNPDEDDESNVREGSDNKVQGSDNKVQDSRNESDA